MRVPSLLAVSLAVPLVVACTVTTHHGDPPPTPQPTPTSNPNVDPLTVVVDTDQTMTAAGGDGVGVFVEYQKGGHWHMWWTCDTNTSGYDCAFDINVTSSSISNPVTEQFASSDSLVPSAGSLRISTDTTTTAPGVTFDTSAGDTIQIDVTMSGIRDGKFFFFVQDGVVNGGYSGQLTDPLIFEPSTP